MKKITKVITIASLLLAVSFVMVDMTTEFFNFEKKIPDVSKSEINDVHFDSGIHAEFAPSVYRGINRDYPTEPTKLTSENLKDIPKIKTMLSLALDIPVPFERDDAIREGITIIDNSNKYFLIQIGPHLVRTESYMSNEEFVKYQSWAEENLNGVPIYDDVPHYYVEYGGEIFWLKFDPMLLKNHNILVNYGK